MARRAFFSFHYERDSWRAGQVRNSWVTKDRESSGFWDAAAWEEVKKKTDSEIEKWIGEQLVGTSVTVVLIGAETSTRQYVGYEIKLSQNRGNGMLGIYIHNMKDVNSKTDTKGTNPLSNWHVEREGKKVLLSDIYPTYDWVNDDGYNNLGSWIEAAAKKAGK
jgi:MTH538 TIR-like domain (DUF1863)